MKNFHPHERRTMVRTLRMMAAVLFVWGGYGGVKLWVGWPTARQLATWIGGPCPCAQCDSLSASDARHQWVVWLSDPEWEPVLGLNPVTRAAPIVWIGIGSVLWAAAAWIRRAGAPSPGRCGVCGYLLTGLDGRPCPECGEANPPTP